MECSLDDEERFGDLMERCADIQRRANGRWTLGKTTNNGTIAIKC